MAVISKGITLSMGEKALTNLMEIPDLGTGEKDTIEVTVLADSFHKYTDGLINYGESLAFKFLYEKTQFAELADAEGSQDWKVTLPDGAICSFGGSASVKLDAVGVNAALTYTLSIKPDSEMVWA